ncbi:MAG TPA: urea transporter [Candidatus Brocadiaceae bacterium]
MNVKNFIEIVLRGISQVFLLNNVVTGILFLIGVFYNSWLMGVVTIAGALIGTVTALTLKLNRNEIHQGLYGYNSTLVALAIISFFGLNVSSIIAGVFGSILSTLLMNFMMKRRLSPYTAPFIASTWIIMAITLQFHIIPLHVAQSGDVQKLEIIPAISNGFGQVMFQENVVTGMLFFAGLLAGSWISALYALLGASLGAGLALACSFPLTLANIGIFGFNAVLCGIAFSGKKWTSLIFAIVSITLAIFITYGIMHLNIITLTSPFVLSTWLILLSANLAQRILPKHQDIVSENSQ